MKPIKQETKYERVPVYDEWIMGTLEEIEYDQEHKRMWEGKEKVGPAVRFKFILEGCNFPKKTPWMTFNYSEKSNLYKKYISALVENPTPNMDFDLDALKGLKIKAMFTQNGEYDNIAMIRPIKARVPFQKTVEPADPVEDEEHIPF